MCAADLHQEALGRSEPTHRDKTAAMRARAEGLKTARESRRKAEADAKYRQHLVAEDQGIREVDRELHREHVATARSTQLDQQRELAEQAAADRQAFEQQWREQQAVKAAEDAAKAKRAREQAEEVASELQMQVAELTRRDAEATLLRHKYDAIQREMYGARFSSEIHAQAAIGSHVCSRKANRCATNGIPLGWSLIVPVHTVNSVQTLKAPIGGGCYRTESKGGWHPNRAVREDVATSA
jgi:hypothetical protein